MEQVSSDFILVAGLFALGAIIAAPMVRLNMFIYHKLGMHKAAAFWESKLHWWIPTLRLTCGVAAITVLGFGLNLI
jgi:hypothetical protein